MVSRLCGLGSGDLLGFGLGVTLVCSVAGVGGVRAVSCDKGNVLVGGGYQLSQEKDGMGVTHHQQERALGWEQPGRRRCRSWSTCPGSPLLNTVSPRMFVMQKGEGLSCSEL